MMEVKNMGLVHPIMKSMLGIDYDERNKRAIKVIDGKLPLKDYIKERDKYVDHYELFILSDPLVGTYRELDEVGTGDIYKCLAVLSGDNKLNDAPLLNVNEKLKGLPVKNWEEYPGGYHGAKWIWAYLEGLPNHGIIDIMNRVTKLNASQSLETYMLPQGEEQDEIFDLVRELNKSK